MRIKPLQPKIEPKEKKQFTESQFESAMKAGATIEKIKEIYLVTPEIEELWNNAQPSGTTKD
jgi:hypothetical protein